MVWFHNFIGEEECQELIHSYKIITYNVRAVGAVRIINDKLDYIKMTALEILKKVRAEMRPNAKVGEYELPVILEAMHVFAALRQLPVSGGSEQFCKRPGACKMGYYEQIKDYYCSECQKTGLQNYH